MLGVGSAVLVPQLNTEIFKSLGVLLVTRGREAGPGGNHR